MSSIVIQFANGFLKIKVCFEGAAIIAINFGDTKLLNSMIFLFLGGTEIKIITLKVVYKR